MVKGSVSGMWISFVTITIYTWISDEGEAADVWMALEHVAQLSEFISFYLSDDFMIPKNYYSLLIEKNDKWSEKRRKHSLVSRISWYKLDVLHHHSFDFEHVHTVNLLILII